MHLLRGLIGKVVLAALVLGVLFLLNTLLSNRRMMDPYYFRILMLSGIAIIMAVSLNLVNGVTGQFSIGHAGFMALGAYASAALTVYGQGRIFPAFTSATPLAQQHAALLAAMLVGGTVAALAGWLVGLPSLRLRGDYLAIVTLGFGEIIRVAILNIDAVGGAAGFSGASVAGHRVTIPALTSFFWIYLVVVVVVLLSRNLLRSTQGLTFFSIREDEIAAEAMGVRTTRVKVTAFVLSAFFAGVAGALYAHFDAYLKPDSFNFLRSIEIVTMVVLGGMGSITGAIIGATILTALPEWLRVVLGDLSRRGALPPNVSADVIRQLLYAILLVLLMLVRPQGIMGHRELPLLGWFSRRPKGARPARNT